jgi:hypothetical protein
VSSSQPAVAAAPAKDAFGNEIASDDDSTSDVFDIIDLTQVYEPKFVDSEPVDLMPLPGMVELDSPKMPRASDFAFADAALRARDWLVSALNAAAENLGAGHPAHDVTRYGEETSEPPAVPMTKMPSPSFVEWLRSSCVDLMSRLMPLAGSSVPATQDLDE